jgi:hypothetical protein
MGPGNLERLLAFRAGYDLLHTQLTTSDQFDGPEPPFRAVVITLPGLTPGTCRRGT